MSEESTSALRGSDPSSNQVVKPPIERSRLTGEVALQEFEYVHERRIQVENEEARSAWSQDEKSSAALLDSSGAGVTSHDQTFATVPANAGGNQTPPDRKIPEGLIGLALSGGGLRSAMFNSGVVQALVRKGFFKDVDFLCTISGGGYFGGHLTALGHRKQQEYEQSTAELKELENKVAQREHGNPASHETKVARQEIEELKKQRPSRLISCEDLGIDGQQQLTAEYRFRDIGQYLVKSLADILTAVGGWFFGTFLITVPTVLCGLSSLALMAAYFWRCFDLEVSRDVIGFMGIPSLSLYFGFSDETLIAFLPMFLLTSACFVSLWGFHFLRRLITARSKRKPESLERKSVKTKRIDQTDSVTGKPSDRSIPFPWKWILFPTALVALVSFFISLAVLLGNGEMQPSVYLSNANDFHKVQNHWITPLFIAGLISSFPWYALRFVARSAKPDASPWQRTALSFCILATATAFPFYLVHWAAMENISGQMTYRDPDLLRQDILNWETFTAVLGKDFELDSLELKPKDGPKPDDLARIAESNEKSETIQRVSQIVATIEQNDAAIYRVADPEFPLFSSRTRSLGFIPFSLPDRLFRRIYLLGDYLVRDWPHDCLSNQSGKRSSQMGQYLDALQESRVVEEKIVAACNARLGSRFLTKTLIDRICDRMPKTAIADEINGVTDDASNTDGKQQIETTFNRLFKQFRKWVGLDSPDIESAFPSRLVNQKTHRKLVANAPSELTDSLYDQEKPEFKHLWTRLSDELNGVNLDDAVAKEQVLENWTQNDLRSGNRLLLEAVYPDIIRGRVMISTTIVPPYDQSCRVRWFWLLFPTFVALLFVDWNWCSPIFHYYQRHLGEAFIKSALRSGALVDRNDVDPKLSDLGKSGSVAPYPIMLAAAEFYSSISNAQHDGYDLYAEWTHPFAFAPRHCGSTSVQYCPTKGYCGGNLRLSDAVAISGAAFSPFIVHKAPIILLLSMFNLRLGRTLPHPKHPSKHWLTISSGGAGLFRWFKTLYAPKAPWTAAFVDDGGFHEFLGLEELLIRRCKLIVVSDAGCNNGRSEFGVLADVLRKCRVKHGMEFLDLDHEIPVDLTRLTRDPKTNTQLMSHVCFRVNYPDPKPGEPDTAIVVYVQMSLTQYLDLDLRQFRNVNPNFPDEPVFNQFFSKDQVESYRQLGYYIGRQILESESDADAKHDPARRCDEKPNQFRTPLCSRAEKWIAAFRKSYLTVRWEAIVRSQKGPFPRHAGDVPDLSSWPNSQPEFSTGHATTASKAGNQQLEDFRVDAIKSGEAIAQFLTDPAVRREKLKWVEEVLRRNTKPTAEECNSIRDAKTLIHMILAVHAHHRGGVYAPVSDVFTPGGRQSLANTVAFWLRSDQHFVSMTDETNLEVCEPQINESLIQFIYQLSDDVFLDAELPTLAYSVAIMAYCQDRLLPHPNLETLAGQALEFLESDNMTGLASVLSNRGLESPADHLEVT